jgi:hypothetical protein
MKLILLVVVLTIAVIPFSVTQTLEGFARVPPQTYELYSWPQSNGIWNFRLLRSPSGVNISAETIFDKKFRLTGIPQLKRKISELPTGTTIIWMSGIASSETPTLESRKLALPSTQTVAQVKRYAGTHGVQMDIPNSSPN